PVSNRQTGFYAGPWSIFNLTQAEFFSWVGPPVAVPPSNANGVYYIDNDAITQNKSASTSFNGVDGEGLMYIDGTCTINNNFNYRGLVYIEGDLKLNGNAWILGGLVVNGITTVKIAGGGAIVLYSGDTISQVLQKYSGRFV